jgi:DNA-binding LacI/PurR family transcriptional regulator
VTTIKDVAAHARVGVGTVSRVINDHPAVTAATRARVRAAIEVLDYEPNRAARALSAQRSGALALVVPSLTRPSAVERLRGVVDAVDASPFELVLFKVGRAEQRRARIARLTRRDMADGLLLVSLPLTFEEARRIRESRLPTVVVDADTLDFDSFVVDDVAGGRLAARHLLDLGHRRIGFVGDAIDPALGFTSSARRRNGLTLELAGAGLTLDPGHVAEGPHDVNVARRQAVELLGQRNRPTAIFAHADTQALGVLEAAAELGLAVPGDLSVIGFDDIGSARHAGLTTVHQPLFESGRLGAQRLLELIRQGGGRLQRTELPLHVIARRTTGPAPTGAGPVTTAHRTRPRAGAR